MKTPNNGLKIPNAPGTKKTFYYKEIKTAYDIAVQKAYGKNTNYDTVVEKVWPQSAGGKDSYNAETLKKMALGYILPNADFLLFIKNYAGKEYNYTFLAPYKGHQSIISKLKLNADGYIRLSSKELNSEDDSEPNCIAVCIAFLFFVQRKHSGEILGDLLFYDYIQTELIAVQERAPLDILPVLAWLLVKAFPFEDDFCASIWKLVDHLIPNILEYSGKSKCVQSLIDFCNNFLCGTKYLNKELDLADYQVDFIMNISDLTKDKWDMLIKLLILYDLDFDLYKEVTNLILQILKVLQMGKTLNNELAGKNTANS